MADKETRWRFLNFTQTCQFIVNPNCVVTDPVVAVYSVARKPACRGNKYRATISRPKKRNDTSSNSRFMLMLHLTYQDKHGSVCVYSVY